MPKFIKIKARDANQAMMFVDTPMEEAYFNCENIIGFQTKTDNDITKNFILINKNVFECEETPQQILALIAECEDN